MMEVDQIESPLGSSAGSACDSSGEDSDLPPLPAYLCITPKKECTEEKDDYTSPLPTTPGSSLTPSLTAVNKSSPASNLYSVSPVRPQENVFRNDEKENRRDKQLLVLNRTRITSSKEQQRREERIIEIEKAGGILAISKQTEENISKVKEDMEAQLDAKQESDRKLQLNEADIPKVPGVPFFTTPPKLCKSHIPFPDNISTDNPLISKITSDIQNFSSVCQLLFAVSGRECPVFVILWLMENSCLSEDVLVRQISSTTLARIASISSSLSSPISLGDVVQLLSKLGASFDKVSVAVANDLITSNSDRDDRFSPQDSELLLNSVSNFCKSLFVILEHFGPDHSNPLLLKDLVLLLLNLVLDPLVCSSIVCDDVAICFHKIITNASVEDWPAIEKEVISHCSFIPHHRNHHFMVALMSSPLPRVSSLQHRLVRTFLSKVLPDVNGDELSDFTLATQVVCHYINTKDKDYSELFSSMKMVAVFMQPPYIKWNAPGCNKRDFIDLLSRLASGIKDNLPGLAVERGPVKDFVIGFKLELQNSSYGEKKQMTIFDYAVEGEESSSTVNNNF